MPCLIRPGSGSVEPPRLGHPLLDGYLELVAARLRPNSVWAATYDLKVFFATVDKDPLEVRTADVLAFVKAQRAPRVTTNVVRLVDGSAGLALSTVKRRLSSVARFYAYLIEMGETATNPVMRGMATRSPVTRAKRIVPLVRPARTLPRILDPSEVDAFIGALRTRRDRAIVEAMLLGGLRRSEALGLRLEDIRSGERRLFIADGKGGHQRLVPISNRFFTTLAAYLADERPQNALTDRVFVVLKGPHRGRALTPKGLEEIITAARDRAGLAHGTCHELRHTCFTRLREAGMALEAVQAQAGHRSIQSTQIYLHLANDWLAGEYKRAAEAIDAQQQMGRPGRAS
jgi:site-specific recombinase XerD